MTSTTKKQSNPKQVSFTASYVCDTKYNSAMFRVIEIPEKYENNEYLTQKLKDYENEQYVYVNRKKIDSRLELSKSHKYKVYLLFEDFTDKKGDYVLYYKQVYIKDKGELEQRQFNNEINESDSD